MAGLGSLNLSQGYLSESERNSATEIRTRLQQCRSPLSHVNHLHLIQGIIRESEFEFIFTANHHNTCNHDSKLTLLASRIYYHLGHWCHQRCQVS